VSESKLRRICKRAWLGPHDLVSRLQFVWRHGPVSRNNAERVDRICNPAKYRGKEGEIEEFARKSRLIGVTHFLSWALLTAGAVLIVAASVGRVADSVGIRPVWVVLFGCVLVVTEFGLLLRRRSL
jgi:hypothetical protein